MSSGPCLIDVSSSRTPAGNLRNLFHRAVRVRRLNSRKLRVFPTAFNARRKNTVTPKTSQSEMYALTYRPLILRDTNYQIMPLASPWIAESESICAFWLEFKWLITCFDPSKRVVIAAAHFHPVGWSRPDTEKITQRVSGLSKEVERCSMMEVGCWRGFKPR